MHFDTNIVIQHLPELARGFRLTLLLVLVSLALGTALGLIACLG